MTKQYKVNTKTDRNNEISNLMNGISTELIIPPKTTTIASGICSKFPNITSVTFPNDGYLTKICESAFAGTKVKSFIIPDGVTEIEIFAFARTGMITGNVTINSEIESISLPASLTKMTLGAFNYCTNLTSITFRGTINQWNSINFGSWSKHFPATYVQCSDGTVTL